MNTKTTVKPSVKPSVAEAQAKLLAKVSAAKPEVAKPVAPIVKPVAMAPIFKGEKGQVVTGDALVHGKGAQGRYAKASNIMHATHVQVLVDNPKRPGTTAHEAFSKYGPKGTTETVAELRSRGVRNDHITWDLARGFVAVLVADTVKA